jgi:hypothetical protein
MFDCNYKNLLTNAWDDPYDHCFNIFGMTLSVETVIKFVAITTITVWMIHTLLKIKEEGLDEI